MVYEVRRTFDVVRRVMPSVVTRHIDRGYRGIVLRIRDSVVQSTSPNLPSALHPSQST